MFSRLNTKINNLNITCKSFLKKDLHWITKNNHNVYTIGLLKDKLNKLNYLEINKNNFVNLEEKLFEIDTKEFNYNVKSLFDCEILERNDSILFDTDPKNLWIMKFRQIEYKKNIVYNNYTDKEFIIIPTNLVYYT